MAFSDHQEICDRNIVVVVITVAWTIWTNRNEVQLGGVKKNGEVLAQWSSHYLEEYRVANIKKSTPIQNLMECWVPPTAPFFKVNVYGVVFAAQQEEGQVVKHHENGQVVATSSQKIKATLDAIEIKAKAFEVNPQFTGRWEFVIEGDSLMI